MNTDKPTLWQRIHAKYRVSVLNEDTLGELLHVRLSLMHLILSMVAMALITLVLFALLIWFTPLKHYLPGYNEGMREQLVQENARVDSLLTMLSVQDEYLTTIKGVVAGEVQVDSVGQLDSLYVVRREELLAAKNEITEEFISDYEAKSKDNLSFFDQAIVSQDVHTLIRPINGVITGTFNEGQFPGVRMTAAKHENVLSVLNGTVVSASYNIQSGWTMMVQHEGDYLSIYSGLEKTMSQVGSSVKAGETIGLVDETHTFGFQLWQRGRALDPQSVIVF